MSRDVRCDMLYFMLEKISTIHLATDHAGFLYKEIIKNDLTEKGYTVKDHGAYELNPSDDYPEFIISAAKEVAKNPDTEKAIILGGSGQGEALVAGRLDCIRTTVCYGGHMAPEIVKLGREHNNANILSLGARFIEEKDILILVDIFLKTEFSKEERHIRRLKQVELLTKKIQ
jgi:ribose 5-phosphate isomerase B